jgi:predicted nucleic acid-binding protein
MLPGSDIVITDTSCLILLSKINQLILLKKLSQNVYVSKEIKMEFGSELPEWIIVKEPRDKHYQKILEIDLDRGEASAIALSLEFDNSILILDDLKGRKYAEKLSLRYSGTFGLIIYLKKTGQISLVKPILEEIRKTNFRFSEILFNSVLKECDE